MLPAMKILLHAVLVLLLYRAGAQPNYKNISLVEAQALAKVNGKMILIQLEASNCDECNMVADKGMSDKEVVAKIDEAFIPVRISSRHPDREEINVRYNISESGFGTLFIDMNGALILKYLRSTSVSQEYKNQLDKALYSSGRA